ncbi:MAG: ComF family protein [Beijerinckiaceae bacterium]|nr:ComF family protein [Beijerinckiaceae bacterium]
MTIRDASPPSGAWAYLRSALARVSTLAADCVYPPSCLACRRATESAGALCPACWTGMPFIERPFCERLGTPFAQDLGDGLLSPAAIAEPPVFERARAVALYEEGPVRKLVQQLKYADRLDLAPPMARWMARAGRELLSDADLLVPVPLYRWRLFTRRFNQAAVLARGVAELSGVAFDPMALVRVKATRPQVGLTRTQRAENVQGAFKVLPTDRIRVEGRKIVLVDDVLTSGATLNAAARVLIRAGAVRVDALVFARVMTHGL